MLQGLKNLGNTCCINTLIQCIGHSDQLREWFLSEDPHKINSDSKDKQLFISIEMARVIHEMWIEKKSLAPVRFLKCLYSSLHGSIMRGDQLDLLELWMLVIDRINEEVGSSMQVPYIEGNTDDIGLFVKSWKKYNEKSMSMLLRKIQGWTATSIECENCKHWTKIYEPFCSLGLEIDRSRTCNSFQEMFRQMFKGETIDQRDCDHCKQSHRATKSTSICMYPDVLIVYFKRFEITSDGITKKIRNGIDIPINLKFVNTDDQHNKYRLSSIGNHIGDLHGGHYYAEAKSDDKWYVYDDIEISEIEDISNILKNNKEAYMIVYERV